MFLGLYDDNRHGRSPHFPAAEIDGQLNFHLPRKDEDDPNIPNQYENPQTHPSVTQYFSNAVSYTPSIEMVFLKELKPYDRR